MKAILLALLGGASAVINKPFQGDKCRALALRGGGTKGAYEAGVLKAMTEMLIPEEYAYDVVEGVSIGALNAGLIATFEVGDEKAAVDKLYDLWLSHPITDLWSNWKLLGPLEGIWRSSLLNIEGLEKMLHENFDGKKWVRGIAIQAVDINTGETVIFDETIPQEKMVPAMRGSSAIPLVFPAQIMDDMVLVDGGAFSNLDINEAI
jgi:predicted acylesterase/phospholipase RssA